MTPAPGGIEPIGFTERLDGIRRRIASASDDPASVRLVAVTKGFGVDAVRSALDAGLTDIGENYADELVAKARELAAGPEAGSGEVVAEIVGEAAGQAVLSAKGGRPEPVWHFLGAIQRNKVARLAPVVSCWQAVSRVEEGRAIAKRRPGAMVLVQVDVAGLAGRGGTPPDQVEGLVAALRDEDLDVAGLMAVGPPGPPEQARAGFRLVSILADRLDLAVRSMGMSDDLEVAVSEGSTMVRLGRALFGQRPPRPGHAETPPGPPRTPMTAAGAHRAGWGSVQAFWGPDPALHPLAMPRTTL